MNSTSLSTRILCFALLTGTAFGAAKTWNNTGTDFNAAGSWTGGAPGSGDVGVFATAESMQPNVTANLTIAGLRFSSGATGYDITSSAGVVLTVNGNSTTGSNGTTSTSGSFVRNDNTTGTTTIDAALNLAPSGLVSTVFQDAADGSTLILNGDIGQTGTVSLSLKNGTIQLNGTNTYGGGTSVDAAGTTVVVGNNSGLGTGTFTINNGATLQAGGGTRTLSNNLVFGADTTISGSNAFIFTGSATSSGSNSRIVTVSNSGGATFNGNVFLSESNTTARSLTFSGSSDVTINGVVSNNNAGNTLASPLKYNGTGTLSLNNTNNYSGGTLLSGGTTIANAAGAFGSGNVSLTAGNVTLTLQNGATNNYIADTANLSIFDSTDHVNLNYNGTDTIGQLIIAGVSQAAGVYGAGDFPELFGTGTLTVTGIPEPATWMLMGVGLLLGAQRLRRKNG